jgi:hypothetical protein
LTFSETIADPFVYYLMQLRRIVDSWRRVAHAADAIGPTQVARRQLTKMIGELRPRLTLPILPDQCGKRAEPLRHHVITR